MTADRDTVNELVLAMNEGAKSKKDLDFSGEDLLSAILTYALRVIEILLDNVKPEHRPFVKSRIRPAVEVLWAKVADETEVKQ